MEEWRERGTGGMEGKNSSTNEHTHTYPWWKNNTDHNNNNSMLTMLPKKCAAALGEQLGLCV